MPDWRPVRYWVCLTRFYVANLKGANMKKWIAALVATIFAAGAAFAQAPAAPATPDAPAAAPVHKKAADASKHKKAAHKRAHKKAAATPAA